MNIEWITLVDENDRIISKVEKYQAHRHPARLHRAVSVWLWREKNGEAEVLLQQRSSKKIVGAGWWGNTVCGNVWWRESYEDCAKRRLRDELGIQTAPSLQAIYSFRYQAFCNDEFGEHEWDTVFIARVPEDFSMTPNPNEVATTQWVSLKELHNVVKTYTDPDDTLPEKASLKGLQKVTQPVKIALKNTDALLAPWTAMILCDARFQKHFA